MHMHNAVGNSRFDLVLMYFQILVVFFCARSGARTATEMDGTLHTDFRKSETSRDIKKYF